MDQTQIMAAALQYIDDNYDCVFSYEDCGDTHFLGSNENKTCRFCTGRNQTFLTKAHAIPEAAGNKNLLSHWECDSCNKLFSRVVEDDFGKWMLPFRMFGRIKGKKDYGAVGGDHLGWSLKFIKRMLTIQSLNKFNIVRQVGDNEIEITIQRSAYIPAAVYKTFVKIGLSVIPSELINSFAPTIDWIRSKDHTSPAISPLHLYVTFIPGPKPFGPLKCFVMTNRKRVTEAIVILMVGNHIFQAIIPHPDEAGRGSLIPHFPSPFDFIKSPFGPIQKYYIDMTSTSRIHDNPESMIMQFSDMIQLTPDQARDILANPDRAREILNELRNTK